MKSTPIKMAGASTFQSFAYLLNCAGSLAQTAKEHGPGSNHCRVSAIMFCAFAIEAHLNHIGKAKVPFWDIIERGLNWSKKRELIARLLEIEIDLGKRPFQTVDAVFKFRDRLAHGKTTTEDRSYDYHAPTDDLDALDPSWLKKYWSDEAVDRALEDTRQSIEVFHIKAGLERHGMAVGSHGNFEEVVEAEGNKRVCAKLREQESSADAER